MNIGDRIKKLRKENKLTLEDLASKVNTTAQTIFKYENGVITNIPSDKIELLAKYLNSTPSYLMGWESQDDRKNHILASTTKTFYNFTNLGDEECDLIKKYWNLDEHGKKAVNAIMDIEHDRCVKEPVIKYETVMKPIYPCSLSAGTGLYVFDDVPSDQIEVPINFSDIDFVISVNGDSMEPSFFNDERVMIKKQHEIQIGEIGAFMVNGEAYIKELGDNCLISHNKKYAPIQFNESMCIDCIGKVIGKL